MNDRQRTRVSKFLSKHLRHAPAELGLTLAPGGWVAIDALLAACAARGLRVSRADLEEVVRTSDKQRFAIDAAQERIRANQGHSVAVEMDFAEAVPPAELYHGTAQPALASIRSQGLHKMSRHHVHLSSDPETARKVGARHGRVVVLTVDAAGMQRDGHRFYLSANGVWLVDAVPPQYLNFDAT
jgi:putative RNA 2'-phosphotransferase